MNPIVMAEGCAKAQRPLPRPAWRGEGGGEGSRFSDFHGRELDAKKQNLMNDSPHPGLLPAKRGEGGALSFPETMTMAFMQLPWGQAPPYGLGRVFR